MPENDTLYTYQGGQKIPLSKSSREFVVRATDEGLADLGLEAANRVSSRSFKVAVAPSKLDDKMRSVRKAAVAHHAYYVGDSDVEFLITDRVLITFQADMDPAAIDAFAAKYNLLMISRYSAREFLFQLTSHTEMNPVKLVVKLTEEESGLVACAEHDLNRRVQTAQLALPADPFYAEQWHLHTHPASPQADPRSSARCEEAWRELDGFGSPSVVVAVADDGCRLDHPDFGADKFAGWGYFQGERLVTSGEPDADPAKMYQAGSNHGTACAGVIAADVNGSFVVGGAPGVKLLPIRFESSGASLFISDSKLRTVLDYVGPRADVMSNSWGTVPFSFWSLQLRTRIASLAANGGPRGRGVVFLFAAGNDNCPIHHDSALDIPYTHGWQVNAGMNPTWIGPRKSKSFSNSLVGVEGVMHVAALASNAQRSHYSNYGTGIGISAPSSNVHEYRRLSVPGLRITTATGNPDFVNRDFGGTSSATPLVAAVAALAISANSQLTARETIALLKSTASKDVNPAGYSRTPPASFDPDTSWDISPVAPFDNPAFQEAGAPEGSWSPWFGHGKVDALAAVRAVRGNAPPPPDPPAAGGNAVDLSSAPGLPIPDNHAAGAADTIIVPDFGVTTAVEADVEIEHTWIGDLRVLLTSPTGVQALLHNRTGSSTRNLKTTYTLASTPALAALVNQPAQGPWTLTVQDVAPRDTGKLIRWSLRLRLTLPPILATDNAAAAIPDNDAAGITRILPVPTGRAAKNITVSVEISHPAIADLRLTVTPPGRPPFELTGFAAAGDRLAQSWTEADTPGLAALVGTDAGGSWSLQAADVTAQSEGKLTSWSVRIAS